MNLGLLRWMRRVMPQGDMALFAIFTDVAIELAYLFVKWWFVVADEEAFRRVRFGWLLICSASYGSYRITGFHPAANVEYRRWLELTPWTADKTLPGGPLQIVPQDLLVIGALVLLYRIPSLDMLYIPIAFLFGYHFTLAVYARLLGHWKLAYLLGLSLSFIAFLIERPEAAFAAANGCFVVGRIAVSRALRTFPWTLPWQVEMRSFKAMTDEEKRRRLGWPYDQLTPKSPERALPLHDGICISLLAGWWWFVILSLAVPDLKGILASMSIFVAFACSLVRFTSYVISHRSPISFFGRLFTLRWLIPSYDQIIISPIMAFATAAVTQGVAVYLMMAQFIRLPLPLNADPMTAGMVISSIGITGTLLFLLVGGPVLEHWKLAAKHRIVFDLVHSEKYGKVDQFVEL